MVVTSQSSVVIAVMQGTETRGLPVDAALSWRQVIKGLRRHTKALLDAHLMVSNPSQWVDDMAAAGVNR